MRMHLSSWIAMSCLSFATMAQSAHAGPWMDAILNRHRPAYPIGPVPVTANYASVVANYGPYATQPPSATGLASVPFGVPQTVAGYLPTATYDTAWNATPVTYYRPVTSFDPRTGTTVTSLQPCTSVQYQAQRVPLASPRPLLGEVGLQSNRWPGITGPGYYPAGLTTGASYAPPYAQPYAAQYGGYQQIPYSGAPVGSASLGTSGVSMGMPASSLPATTYQPSMVQPVTALMPAAVVSNVPTVSYPSNTSYPAAGTYPLGTTISSSYPTVSPSSIGYGASVLPPVSTVVPAAANVPAYASPATSSYYAPAANNQSPCANGVCPVPGSAASTVPAPSYSSPSLSGAAPNIPGAASVTPYGAPTYSAPTGIGSGAVVPSTSAPSYPSYPTNPPSALPPASGLPGSSILPPSGLPSGDPEATRQPSLNGSASVQRPATELSPTLNQLSGGMLPRNPSQQPESWIDQALMNREPVPVPSTLRPTTNSDPAQARIVPLESPAGIDAKPRWNPNLLDSDDPVAANEASGRTERARPVQVDSSRLKFISNERVSDGFQPTFRPKRN
ncbi:hypothetical protein SH467x_002559 [Pirellulaceae bacterium SH467]